MECDIRVPCVICRQQYHRENSVERQLIPSFSFAEGQLSYTYNNFYSGSDKKIEILLPELKKELTQMREEIKSLKENRTISTGNYAVKVPTICYSFISESASLSEEVSLN